jgi:hypothetical protein
MHSPRRERLTQWHGGLGQHGALPRPNEGLGHVRRLPRALRYLLRPRVHCGRVRIYSVGQERNDSSSETVRDREWRCAGR